MTVLVLLGIVTLAGPHRAAPPETTTLSRWVTAEILTERARWACTKLSPLRGNIRAPLRSSWNVVSEMTWSQLPLNVPTGHLPNELGLGGLEESPLADSNPVYLTTSIFCPRNAATKNS